MMLADDPNHHGLFGEAEYHVGLMDLHLTPRPGLDALFSDRACTPDRTLILSAAAPSWGGSCAPGLDRDAPL